MEPRCASLTTTDREAMNEIYRLNCHCATLKIVKFVNLSANQHLSLPKKVGRQSRSCFKFLRSFQSAPRLLLKYLGQ